ncbi:hypothetical protein VPNG_00987 [Cytospora leucostoma]|uniref:Uncharacterized protein n=1 Tax=Cytospora leucostoma TaxID=1230097 RepID=A0A423XLP1_9PEZI|nr:hypothetical protein VPNG_00987 [Cytospora leucostoma]
MPSNAEPSVQYQYQMAAPSHIPAGPVTASNHSTVVSINAEPYQQAQQHLGVSPHIPAGPVTASNHITAVPSVAEQSPNSEERLPTPSPTRAGPVTAGNHSPVVPTGGHQVEQPTQEATPQVADLQTEPSGSQQATDTAEQQHTQEQGTLTQPAAATPSAPSKKESPQDDTAKRPEYRAIFTIPYDPAVFLPVLQPRAPIVPGPPVSSAFTAHDEDDDEDDDNDDNNISAVVKRRNFWGKVDESGGGNGTYMLAALRRTKKFQRMARKCTCKKSTSKKSTSNKSASEKSALETLRSVPDLLDFPPPRLAGFLPGDQAAHSEDIIEWITGLVRKMRATRPGNGPIGGAGGGAGGGGGGHDDDDDDDDDDGDNGDNQGDGPGEADYDDAYGFCPPDLAVDQDEEDDQVSGEAPESEAVAEEPAEAPVQDGIIVASPSSVPVAAARSDVRKRSRDEDSGDEADDEEPAKRHRGDGLSAPTEPEAPTTPAPSSSVQVAPDALSGLTSSMSGLKLKRTRDSDEEVGDVSKRRRTKKGDETHQRAAGAQQRPLAAISSRRNVGNSTTNPQVFNLGALSAALPSTSATPAPRPSSPSSSTPPPPAPSANPTTPTVTTPPAQAGSQAQAQPPSSTRSQAPRTQADGSQIAESLGQMTLNDSAAPIPGDRQVAPRTFRLSVPRRTQPWTFGQESAAPGPAPAHERVYTHEWVRVMLSSLPVDILDTSEQFRAWVAPWVNNQAFLEESDTWVQDRWPAADHDTGVPITYGGLRQLLREWSTEVVGRWIRERVRVTSAEGGWREAAQSIAWDLSARLGDYIERHPGKREDDAEYDENGREVKKSKRR